MELLKKVVAGFLMVLAAIIGFIAVLFSGVASILITAGDELIDVCDILTEGDTQSNEQDITE